MATKRTISRRGRCVAGLAAAALVLALTVPGNAGAGVQLGQVTTGDPLDCGSEGGSLFQFDTTGVSYQVPFPGGVITSWSHRGKSGTAGSGRLQLWGEVVAGEQYILAGRSALASFSPGVVNSFPTRIRVNGGERLGLGVIGGAGCAGSGTGIIGGLGDANPAVGETRSVDAGLPNLLINVAAILEPDADDDGFGDETQDQCPGDAGQRNGCPPLRLKLSAKAQKLGKRLTFLATASARSSLATTGKSIKGGRKQLVAGQRAKVTAKLKRAARKRLARQIRRRGKARTRIRGVATHADGRTGSDRVVVRLRR